MAGLLILLATGGVIFVLATAGIAAWVLMHPPRKTYAWSVAHARPGDPSEMDAPRAFTSWSFTSRGMELPVWDVEGDAPDGPVVVVTHGWGDSRIGGLVRLDAIAAHARRVVMWDMPGHGDAPGGLSMGAREVDDLLALVERVGETPIVLYGWSLGAGVSIAAAHQDERVVGVIGEAPYRQAITPARNVMRMNHLPHRVNLPIALWFLGLRFGGGPTWRGFDRCLHAAKLACPLLVLHGSDDPISPIGEARKIASAAHDECFVQLDGGSHNDLWTAPWAGLCDEAVRKFIQACGPSREPAVHCEAKAPGAVDPDRRHSGENHATN